ncbi:MAG: helix-turn-helix domain-containing protein [Alphaproteobacteria bacterium]
MTHADCGALIRALRDQAGITQAELAESLLREPAEIAAIEMGDLAVTERDTLALGRVFDLDAMSVRAMSESTHLEAREAA